MSVINWGIVVSGVKMGLQWWHLGIQGLQQDAATILSP